MRKFHSILLASSPVEQVEIIARSRTAAFDRQTKQINKVTDWNLSDCFPASLSLPAEDSASTRIFN